MCLDKRFFKLEKFARLGNATAMTMQPGRQPTHESRFARINPQSRRANDLYQSAPAQVQQEWIRFSNWLAFSFQQVTAHLLHLKRNFFSLLYSLLVYRKGDIKRMLNLLPRGGFPLKGTPLVRFCTFSSWTEALKLTTCFLIVTWPVWGHHTHMPNFRNPPPPLLNGDFSSSWGHK